MARLAILIPDMSGGGAERVALTLADGFVTKGHQVDLVLLRSEGELLDEVPPDVRIFDLQARRMRHALLPLVRYLKAERPHALLAVMWPLPIVAVIARFLARAATRIISSDHAILSEHYRGQPKALASLRMTIRTFYPAADARVAASAAIADDLAGMSGLKRSTIDVIANPIAMPGVMPHEPDVDQMWGGSGPRILSVGTLKPEKNHRLLLKAFAPLAHSHDARLMILGEGALRDDLEDYSGQLGIADRVVMPGFRANPWPYYASANLFALSSDTEGFGNVLIEAMAAGLPIVSTDLPATRDILADGEFGRLVPVGDAGALCEAMTPAISGPVDRVRLKRRAADYRPARAIDACLSLLLGRPGVAR